MIFIQENEFKNVALLAYKLASILSQPWCVKITVNFQLHILLFEHLIHILFHFNTTKASWGKLI